MNPDRYGLEDPVAALLSLSATLNSAPDLDALFETLLEELMELAGADSASAGLRASRGAATDYYRKQPGPGVFTTCERPVTGWPDRAMATGTYYLTNNALNDPLIPPEIRDRFGIRSAISVPIIDSGRDAIAFVEVYNKRSEALFTPADVNNCERAAQIASPAIQNILTTRRLLALAAFSRSLLLAADLEQVLEIVCQRVTLDLDRGSAVLLPAEAGLTMRFRNMELLSTDKELKAATACWTTGQAAGAATESVPDAQAHYIPLTARGSVIGVLAIESRVGEWFPAAQREFLAGLIGPAALAIEHGLLEQKMRRLRFLDGTDRIQKTLLAAVSHELRAPLGAISAVVSGLLDPDLTLGREGEHQLLRTAAHEAKRLHRLMNNLLSVTRLNSDVWRLKIEPSDLMDVVGAAIEELGVGEDDRAISVDIQLDLPLIPLDFGLITQVLVNLLGNALKFSPQKGSVHLRGAAAGEMLDIEVSDRGVGIPEEELDRVFQKFHRLNEKRTPDGLGLGLAICKEFVEAHRGTIRLQANPGGGTVARIELPIHPQSRL